MSAICIVLGWSKQSILHVDLESIMKLTTANMEEELLTQYQCDCASEQSGGDVLLTRTRDRQHAPCPLR